MPVIAYPYTTKYKQFLIDSCYCLADDDAIAKALDDALACYDEDHRAYHTRIHLEEMFKLLDEMAEIHGLNERDLTIAALAIFYHDVVYLTNTIDQIADNEIESGNRALNDMSRLIGVDECDLQEDVDAIIIATKDHDIDPEQNPIGALVIDIDMAILGADKERYRQYRAQIRKEFSAFPDDVFNQTRRDSFLYPSVRKPRLYLTDVMQDRFGDYAVENMFEEIGDLNRLIPRRARDSAFSAKPA